VNTVELPLMNIQVIDWSPDGASNPIRPFMVQWAHRQLTGLEGWLEGREFIATDAFTVADILMSHVLSPIKDETLLAPYARVRAYRDRCKSRDAWRRTIDAYCERVEPA
jgi:glutathione S-transferase